jgi:hypothetical protein
MSDETEGACVRKENSKLKNVQTHDSITGCGVRSRRAVRNELMSRCPPRASDTLLRAPPPTLARCGCLPPTHRASLSVRALLIGQQSSSPYLPADMRASLGACQAVTTRPSNVSLHSCTPEFARAARG